MNVMRLIAKTAVNVLLVVGLAGVAAAVPPVLRTGDGMGVIDGYDRAQQAVMIGTQRLGLMPMAAASLEEQLAGLGMTPAQRFSARFNVVPATDGRLLIDSIYVVPPKQP